jgi:predicted sulfurtransferase
VPLETNIFSESWDRLEELLADVPRDKPLLTFCTGGIRCVKVNAFLRQRLGFMNVGRLKKGIIGYQQWISNKPVLTSDDQNPDKDDSEERRNASLFEGDNFIFDRRRLVAEDSSEGSDQS